MSTIGEKTNEVFVAVTHGNDSLGYPDGVEFVPGDRAWADDLVWRNLAEDRRATVIVDDETELLLAPLRRRLIDRLRGPVRKRVTHRTHRHAAAYATASTHGRHPVREMRALALT